MGPHFKAFHAIHKKASTSSSSQFSRLLQLIVHIMMVRGNHGKIGLDQIFVELTVKYDLGQGIVKCEYSRLLNLVRVKCA